MLILQYCFDTRQIYFSCFTIKALIKNTIFLSNVKTLKLTFVINLFDISTLNYC